MKSSSSFVLVCSVLLTVGCSSSSPRINYSDSRRFLGRDNDVRVDAQMTTESVGTNSTLHLNYEIQNLRNDAIAVDANVVATSYDEASRTITIELGAEIPDAAKAIRLTTIASGEKKSFAASARVRLLMPNRGPFGDYPRYVRVKLNYLNDPAIFASTAVVKVTNDLFPKWVETNDTVYTNALPIDWSSAPAGGADVTSRASMGSC
jgi:hypothetical protein